jgi:hypothetical protein
VSKVKEVAPGSCLTIFTVLRGWMWSVAYARATSRIPMSPLANSIASACPSANEGWKPTALNRLVVGL